MVLPENPTLDDVIKACDMLRISVLFEVENKELNSLPPFAEQHLLQGLAYLELAKTAFTMADYCRMQNQ